MAVRIGGHRGFGCTDHAFYKNYRQSVSLPTENTIDSIKAAFAASADFVEIDVAQSNDGCIFLIHSTFPKEHIFGNDQPSLD